MSIRIVESALQTGVVFETAVGEFVFSASWERPGAPSEIQCMNMANTSGVITENQLKAMVTAFREAKARINAEIEALEALIKPYVDHISQFGEREE